jgi:acylphosphatase
MVQHFLVKGRVQGVGFRWFVQREAAEIGLRGWVRNTDGGHVEVLAAGEPEQLKDLAAAAWMRWWSMSWRRAKARS